MPRMGVAAGVTVGVPHFPLGVSVCVVAAEPFPGVNVTEVPALGLDVGDDVRGGQRGGRRGAPAEQVLRERDRDGQQNGGGAEDPGEQQTETVEPHDMTSLVVLSPARRAANTERSESARSLL